MPLLAARSAVPVSLPVLIMPTLSVPALKLAVGGVTEGAVLSTTAGASVGTTVTGVGGSLAATLSRVVKGRIVVMASAPNPTSAAETKIPTTITSQLVRRLTRRLSGTLWIVDLVVAAAGGTQGISGRAGALPTPATNTCVATFSKPVEAAKRIGMVSVESATVLVRPVAWLINRSRSFANSAAAS